MHLNLGHLGCWYADTSSLKMINNSFIRLCTFNCRSFKNSLPAIVDLCNSHDIVLLQEHWLLPSDLGLLNVVHAEFQGVGLSAVDVSNDILVGRPYGGTAIFYHKSLANAITVVDSDESRIAGICVETSDGPMLILNVYMPTNCNDDASLELANVKCEKLKTKFDSYASFSVILRVDESSKQDVIDLLMSGDSWPEGVLIRKFYMKRNG